MQYESERVEYKSQMIDDIYKEVIAFANTDGGTIYIGVDDNGNIVTNGGRVLGITATGSDLKEARAKAYDATKWIDFANKFMRNDIGKAIDEA